MVLKWSLKELGELHYGRKKIQPASRAIREFYERAEGKLKFQLATFDKEAVRLISEAFATVIASQGYTCYGCSIMRDHVHVVTRKHKHRAEDMIDHLQEVSRSRLLDVGLREPNHPVWGGAGWKVFLDQPEDVRRTVKYVEDNPIKARTPRQDWRFVTPYDNWPFHVGSRLRR